MNIIERGNAFLQSLQALATRSSYAWRCCPGCRYPGTWKHGTYTRQPWFLSGRQPVVVQRYYCPHCRRTYSADSALVRRGSWYAREVQRLAVDHWQHVGSSLRRTAELLRSLLGRQERWHLWRPVDPDPPSGQPCRLSASTIQRWLDRAGQQAQAMVTAHLAGVATSGELGTDGLWARLKHGVMAVVLALSDSVTGVVWPPVVVAEEATPGPWGRLFDRAALAGLDLDAVRGVTSDGAPGIAAYLDTVLVWVHHQRCVWHLWRNLTGCLADAGATAAGGLGGAAATAMRRATRQTLVGLVRAVLNAPSDAAAVTALAQLFAHPLGQRLGVALRNEVEAALVYQNPYNAGLQRVGPEWVWRDFRLRLSHGRNHRSAVRLERAALVWAVYHNFTPRQARKERQRRYRHPGRSPIAVAGVAIGPGSYLDALAV